MENMALQNIMRFALFFVFICCVACNIVTEEGVEIEIITPPANECVQIKIGDWVSVLYNMTKSCGKILESTYNIGSKNKTVPQEYYFGVDSRNGVVIGLAGACKGERRKLLIPSPLMSQDPAIAGDTLIYDAIVADHVVAEDKHRLREFWSMDWNTDKYIDLEEIDMALSREGFLENIFQDTSGIENMSDMIIGVFDKDGDEALDRDEFFEMHRNINIPEPEEEPPTTVKEPESKRRRRKRDEL